MFSSNDKIIKLEKAKKLADEGSWEDALYVARHNRKEYNMLQTHIYYEKAMNSESCPSIESLKIRDEMFDMFKGYCYDIELYR